MRSTFPHTAFEKARCLVSSAFAWASSAFAASTVACVPDESSPQPTPVVPPRWSDPPVVEMVAAGTHHSCALMSDTTVRCWGSNTHGELGRTTGLGGRSPDPAPVEDAGSSHFLGATHLALGSSASCAQRGDGSAWCWGDNYFGQLGTGALGGSFTFPPARVALDEIAQISLGWSCCAIRADQSLWCWSSWHDGPPEPSPIESPWVSEARELPPANPFCIVLPDQTAMCRGSNYAGQVGDGTFVDRESFTPVVGMDQITAIVRGGGAQSGHACAIARQGRVYCWGNGVALGTGNREDSALPKESALDTPAVAIAAGNGATCAVLADQTLWCWGNNFLGQLGDGTDDDRLLPFQVAGLDAVRSVAMGFGHTCALLENRTVWCWGYNHYGQLGSDATSHESFVPVQVRFDMGGES
jgi:alpha-tubulin suppressor-like RCC1 family protein